MDHAALEAVGGGRVLYACKSWERAREALEAFESRGYWAVKKVTRSFGDMRVVFESGGVVTFLSATPHSSRGFVADLLCLDGVTDERTLECLLPCTRGAVLSF